MFIAAVYIRFFRSFNFDYLRKAHKDFVPDPWDVLEPEKPYLNRSWILQVEQGSWSGDLPPVRA
jgi:hypothetical protein